MKKRIIILFVLLIAIGNLSARVRNNSLALGFEVGSLFDLNAKYHTSEYTAYEFYFSPNPNNWYLVGAGWKAHITNLFDFEPDIYFYYGPELYLFLIDGHNHPFFGKENAQSEMGVSALGTVGFSYFPDEIPLEVYSNLGAGINTNPELGLVFKFVFGMRIKIAELGAKN